jgi:transcriptional regulator GlxA family with amidase domain
MPPLRPNLSGVAGSIAALPGGSSRACRESCAGRPEGGCRALTHWNLVDLLTARHPRVRVEPDALFIEDGNLWTAAGSAAGIDLCLHLVRSRHGAEAAASIARSMVTAPFRTGTQAQFVEHPTPRTDRDADTPADVRAYALGHLHEPLTVHVTASK